MLMADDSEAITNGFSKTFGAPKTRLMCFFHLIKNVDKHLRSVKNVEFRKNLKEDTYVLQPAQNPEHFQNALFLRKWQRNSDNHF